MNVAMNAPRSLPGNRRYRALPIYWTTSLALRWHGRADRRAGLPLGMSPDATPVLQGLVARHDDACERERTRFLADVRAIDVRLDSIAAELPLRRATLARRTDEAAGATLPPTEAQLTHRLAGERGLPDALIRQRRQRRHEQLAHAAVVAQLEAQRAVDALLGEQAQLEARRHNRAEIARSRVLRYGDLIRRQAAVYRRALVRKHPDREALVHQWRTELCPPPAWATTGALTVGPADAGVAA